MALVSIDKCKNIQYLIRLLHIRIIASVHLFSNCRNSQTKNRKLILLTFFVKLERYQILFFSEKQEMTLEEVIPLKARFLSQFMITAVSVVRNFGWAIFLKFST